MTGQDTQTAQKRKTACIVGAGEFTDRGIWDPYDLVIAADGGLSALTGAGIHPDVIVGDFDSLGYVPDNTGSEPAAEGGERTDSNRTDSNRTDSNRTGSNRVTDAPEIIRLPVEKDDTDMAAACRIAWERGCTALRIYGGSGDRPDHFLANLQLAAAYSRKDGEVRMITPGCTVFAITDGSICLESGPGVTFSVFCHSDHADGVTIEGDVRYSLKEAQLTNIWALGVSNCMTGTAARITVRSGTLLVFLYETDRV